MASSAGGLPATVHPPDPPPQPPDINSTSTFPIISNNFIKSIPKPPSSSTTPVNLVPPPPHSTIANPISHSNRPMNFASAVSQGSTESYLKDFSFINKPNPLVNGMPSFLLAPHEWRAAEKPFHSSLIMKFSGGRPKMEEVRHHIHGWNLSKKPIVGHMDARHVLVFIQTTADMNIALARSNRQVANSLYRLFRWSPEFNPRKESSNMPVWVRFPNLPLPCLHDSIIRGICNTIGSHIKTDPRSLNLENPSLVRACIELDLNKKLPENFWLGSSKEEGGLQKIIYEGNVRYCRFCDLHGHAEEECRKKMKSGSRAPTKNAPTGEEPPRTDDRSSLEERGNGERFLAGNQQSRLTRATGHAPMARHGPDSPLPHAQPASTDPCLNPPSPATLSPMLSLSAPTIPLTEYLIAPSIPPTKTMDTLRVSGRHTHKPTTLSAAQPHPIPLSIAGYDSMSSTHTLDLNNTLGPPLPIIMDSLIVSGRQTHMPPNTHSATTTQPNPLTKAGKDNRPSTHVLEFNNTISSSHTQIMEDLSLSGRQAPDPITLSAIAPQPNPSSPNQILSSLACDQTIPQAATDFVVSRTVTADGAFKKLPAPKARDFFNYPPARAQQAETSTAGAMPADCLASEHGLTSGPLLADQDSQSTSTNSSTKKRKESKKVERNKKLLSTKNSKKSKIPKSINNQAINLGLEQTEGNESFFSEEENLTKISANNVREIPSTKITKSKNTPNSRPITRLGLSKDAEDIQGELDDPIIRTNSVGGNLNFNEDTFSDYIVMRSKTEGKKSKKTKT